MNDGRALLGWKVGYEHSMNVIDEAQITGSLLLPLPVPASKLAREVISMPAKVVEADRDKVDLVYCGERFGH